MLRKMDVIVAGAGLSGVTTARELAEKGKKVLIVEKKSHVGGHCYDAANEHGIRIQHFGPHIFHTSNKVVWDFLSRFTDWYHYQHKVTGLVDGQLVVIPFNLNTLYQLFSGQKAVELEKALLGEYKYDQRISILDLLESKNQNLNFLGDYIYRKIFLNYTMKQWGGSSPKEIDPAVVSRVPIVISRNDNYFDDIYQGIPLNGYTRMIEEMVSHPNIHLLMNTDVHDVITLDKGKISFCNSEFKGQFIYTGPIDELFGDLHGHLPYRSLHFEMDTIFNETYQQKSSVVNYPNNYDFTRITEFKYFQRSEHQVYTTLCKEFPCDYVKGENYPYYVIENEKNRSLYFKYKELADQFKGLHCLGRLGEYKYYNMDQAVESGLALVEKLG